MLTIYLEYVYKGLSQPTVIHNPCAKLGDRHRSWTLYAVLSTEGVCHRSWTLWGGLSTCDGQTSHFPSLKMGHDTGFPL